MRGLFDMANNNTLLALAYIREGENPLIIISNLVQYVFIKSTTKKVRFDVLKENVCNEFGLRLPNHLLECALRVLKKDGIVQYCKQEECYELLKPNFDIDKFNVQRTQIELSEKHFIDDLTEYVNETFKLNWDNSKASKTFLSLFLVDNYPEKVLEIDSSTINGKQKYIDDTWYVKKYILNLLEQSEGVNYDYLQNLYTGLIAFNGLTHISDYNQTKNEKFKGTRFFLDTKILLRILGFSFPYYTDTAKELLELIQKEYGGTACVLRHTIKEIKHALSLAESDLNHKRPIKNYEMNFHHRESGFTSEDYKIAQDSVEQRLREDFSISFEEDHDLNDGVVRSHFLDTDKLEKYLKTNNSDWSNNAVINDVSSINHINIERKGRYDVKFGGKNKLPIFVTSNSKLVHDIKQFGFEFNDSVPWNTHCLPMITDYALTCRLWLTLKDKEPISLKMMKTAYLYQQADADFYNKIMESYAELKSKHNYNVVDLDYERFEKLKELIIVKTEGNLEEITEDVVAISFEELASRQSARKDDEIKELSRNSEKKSVKIDELTNDLIASASRRFVNKIGVKYRIALFSIKSSPIIAAIVGIVVGYCIDLIITEELFSPTKFWLLILCIPSIVFVIIDKWILKDSKIEQWISEYKNRVKKKYTDYITCNLLENEKTYSDRIVRQCIKDTDFFEK